jgi:hypothetical protein
MTTIIPFPQHRADWRVSDWTNDERHLLDQLWERLRSPYIVERMDWHTDRGDPVMALCNRQGIGVFTISRVGGTYVAVVDDGDCGEPLYRGGSMADLAIAMGLIDSRTA